MKRYRNAKSSRLVRPVRSVLMTAVALLCWADAVADSTQTDTCGRGSQIIHHIGLDVRGAYVAPARDAVKRTYIGSSEKDAAMSWHLKYSFGYSETTRTGRLYPGAYQGIGVGSTTFFANNLTGMPVTAYLFQGAPIVRLAKGLTFDYEWNFGASFGWKKYNEDSNPINVIVGSPVNAYINLGFMLSYRLDAKWNLTAGIDLTHYSNGNTALPNPGVNTLGGRLGVTYTLNGDRRTGALADNFEIEPMKPHLSYDLVIYGAVRKKVADLNGPEELPGHFGIAGLNFAPMYNFNRFLRAGVSLDVQYDESSDIRSYWIEGTYGDEVKFYRPPFFHQVSWGLSARGELVMPIFSINAGLGYNLFGNTDAKNFYQVLALKIHLARSFFLHVGYQLNSFKNPNNLMIGVGYRFHDRR